MVQSCLCASGNAGKKQFLCFGVVSSRRLWDRRCRNPCRQKNRERGYGCDTPFAQKRIRMSNAICTGEDTGVIEPCDHMPPQDTRKIGNPLIDVALELAAPRLD